MNADVNSNGTLCTTRLLNAMFMHALNSPVHPRAPVGDLDYPFRPDGADSPTRAAGFRGPCFVYTFCPFESLHKQCILEHPIELAIELETSG